MQAPSTAQAPPSYPPTMLTTVPFPSTEQAPQPPPIETQEDTTGHPDSMNIEEEPLFAEELTQVAAAQARGRREAFESDRSEISVQKRWGAIQTGCNKFQAAYDHSKRMPVSIMGMKDLVWQALDFYKSNNEQKTFAFPHCWKELHGTPRFQEGYEGYMATLTGSKTAKDATADQLELEAVVAEAEVAEAEAAEHTELRLAATRAEIADARTELANARAALAEARAVMAAPPADRARFHAQLEGLQAAAAEAAQADEAAAQAAAVAQAEAAKNYCKNSEAERGKEEGDGEGKGVLTNGDGGVLLLSVMVAGVQGPPPPLGDGGDGGRRVTP
nr:flagellar radial spoke protein 2-like [Lolium perenne]